MKKITLLLIMLLLITGVSSANYYSLTKTIDGVSVVTTVPEGNSVTLQHIGSTSFVKWQVNAGTLTISNPTSKTLTFQMPSSNLSIEAVIHVHQFVGATCTTPATCSCGETKGTALGHSYTGTVTCDANQSTDTVQCIRCTSTESQTCTHTYTISKGSETNGTITLSKTSVKAGGSATATITPSSGYKIDSIQVNGSNVAVTTNTGMTYTFSNVTSDQTINVTFAVNNSAPNTPTITVASKTTTSLTFTISGTDPDNDSLTYDVYVGGSKKGSTTSSSYTATSLTHGTQYQYYVVANDPSGETATSATNSTYTNCKGTGSTCTTSQCDGTCGYCGGDGEITDSERVPCSTCGGTGEVPCSGTIEYVYDSDWACGSCGAHFSVSCYECTVCSAWYESCGSCGYTYGETDHETECCPTCGGYGEVYEVVSSEPCDYCVYGECSHGKRTSHRYCTHYTTTTLTSHSYCRHGNTSEHECTW